jgi:Tol biopolymer transport system component
VLKDPGLYLYDIARDTETHLADVSWQSLAWSPDSRRLAHIAFNEDRTADVVVTAIAEQRSQRITGAGIHMNRMAVEGDCWPAEEKIVWTAGGDRLQIVQNRTPQSFGITTVTLDGQVVENRTLGVADPADNRRYVDCYHPAPDGRFIVAFRFSGDGGIPERNTSLVGIDAGTGQVREVAPPSSFVAWLGRTSRFVVSNNEGGSFRYYVADAAQGR